MTGYKYWRLKRRMTIQDLAQKSGCCAGTIWQLEQRATDTTSSMIVGALSKALGVPMAEFLKTYPDNVLADGDHPTWAAKETTTVLSQYRTAHNLTYKELMARLGAKSRQHAEILCKMETPPQKNLLHLAEYEKVTVDELLRRYQMEEDIKCVS